MLVLTRKTEERIQIGDHITITILRIRGREVQIGIEAPQQYHILRGELLDTHPARHSSINDKRLALSPSLKTSPGSLEPNSDRCPTDTAAPSCEVSSTPTETVGPRQPAPRQHTASMKPPVHGAEPASSHRRIASRGVHSTTLNKPRPTIAPVF